MLIPSTSPSYYLGITGVNPVSGQASGSVAATVRLASNGTEIVTVQELTEMAGASRAERGDADGMTIDKRFHFIPAANLLITIPPTNDRLVLRRLDLDRAIASSEKPLLLVTSPSELSARPRQDLVHLVQARSSRGAGRFELATGPPGLTVSPDGTLNWRVPLAPENKAYEAVLTISDPSGRQIFHTIRIKVE